MYDVQACSYAPHVFPCLCSGASGENFCKCAEELLLCQVRHAEVQAEGVREAQLRGPLPFPQERLLSYFWNLLKSEGGDGGAFNQNDGAAQQQQSAEVFMLLRSLVSLRLLSQARINIWLLCTHVGNAAYSS